MKKVKDIYIYFKFADYTEICEVFNDIDAEIDNVIYSFNVDFEMSEEYKKDYCIFGDVTIVYSDDSNEKWELDNYLPLTALHKIADDLQAYKEKEGEKANEKDNEY